MVEHLPRRLRGGRPHPARRSRQSGHSGHSGHFGLRPAAVRAAALTAALGMALLTAQAAAAVPAGGTKGSPQPELAQFKVGSSGGLGSGAVLANGNLVLAWTSKSGGSIGVCVLHPGGRKCASRLTLPPEAGDTFSGTPEVLVTGATDVSVVAEDCCNSTPDNVFVFSSTDGATTFRAPAHAGTIGSVGAGTEADGQLVVGTYTSGSLNVQAFPPNPAGPAPGFATPNNKADGDTSLATYHGGVLVASDDLTNAYVEYARSGSDFNVSGSYKAVGTFRNELVTGVSGNALLTDPGGSLTGGERLRFFNGASFGKAYKVPDVKNGDDGYFAMQEVGGVVHVFFLSRRNSYDVYTETTTDGAHWSRPQRYGSAIGSALLAPVLGPTGAGLVFEADGSPLLAQPILNPQNVHVSLAHRKVKPGHSTKLTGRISPHLKNQRVTLEDESHGRWFAVKTTRESASGTFSFTVPGKTKTYRAVVADKPGYYLYGYSRSVKLTAAG